jgi:hypothetical protein
MQKTAFLYGATNSSEADEFSKIALNETNKELKRLADEQKENSEQNCKKN